MTLKTVNQQASPNLSVPVVLFGVDEHGKPKAARFLDKHANLAAKAAEQLNLQVLQIIGPEVSDLAARLPQGRIHANGRGFVPYIRRDLYARLLAAANGSLNSPAATPVNVAGVNKPSLPKQSDKPVSPRHWDSIAVGHQVIALDEPENGWYEAIITEIHGEMLTMRWRHYPKERRIMRHRLSVGLLYPDELPATEPAAQQPEFPTIQDTPSATDALEDLKPVYPQTWDNIDLNCLVLMKEDGPWRGWWEAVPVAKAGNQLLLRWRAFPQLPNVVRSRWALGLLYPNGR